MKNISSLLVFFLLNFFMQITGFAQSTPEQLRQMRSTVTQVIDGREFYIHTVKRGQTLYMISKAYGVEVNDIIRENPQVKDGIKADEKLRILLPGQKSTSVGKSEIQKDKAKPAKETAAAVPEKVQKKDSVIVVELPCGVDTTYRKPVYNIALMLPLALNEVEQINAVNPDPKVFETIKSFRFLPYYEGFLLALDSLKRQGLKIRLYVYDVGKDTAKTRQLLKKPEMKSMDLIFGLLYHANFQIVASFAKKNKINLVNPISERGELINGNPFVYKAQPAKKAQLAQLAAYMSVAFADGRVFIVRNGKYHDREAPDLLKKACEGRNLIVTIVDGQEAAIVKYLKDKPNYVVVFSDNQAHMLDLMRSMYKLRNEFNLTLVGLPNWSVVDGLETEYLVALKTHMMSGAFIDYEKPEVIKFVGNYQEKYKTDPELLAFQGFDQCYYFLTAIKTYGTNIGRCIHELKMPGLVNRFEFLQGKDSGFENNAWTICKYDNYRIVSVD